MSTKTLPSAPATAAPRQSRTAALAIAAIGVVYGDIGTSPLYTMRESFSATYGLSPTPADVLGVLSLIFWALMLVVTVKYVVFVMRADNRGEGGIIALQALALRKVSARSRRVLMIIALGGAALFYGDGIITPAISVLSAVEGLEVATPLFQPVVVPLSLAVIVGLFSVQRFGTERVGNWFGPIMCAWFACLGALGLWQIILVPDVLWAINPLYAVWFTANHGFGAFLALGAIVLAVTGAEALYADIGHFGKRPIQLAWLRFVFPALALNYFGQGALILADPTAVRNPFYLLAPSWALYPMVALATMATVIASQAMISGAFSITRQAIQLGFAPRLEVRHTSDETIGQVYMPQVNWALLVAVVALVIGFGTSSALAAAYGIAVTGTFLATTVLMYAVARWQWRWGAVPVGIVVAGFFLMDLAFFSANVVKIPDGGWFPLVIGALILLLMLTWRRGREVLFRRLRDEAMPLTDFVERQGTRPITRVPGTAIFMTGTVDVVPHALLHNLKHNKVLHERVVILTVQSEDVPYVADGDRVTVTNLPGNFFKIVAHYGFKETPDIPALLKKCGAMALTFNMMETSFFLGRESLVPRGRAGMALWREKLFIRMARNGLSAVEFFKIPPNRVVELGTQVEL